MMNEGKQEIKKRCGFVIKFGLKSKDFVSNNRLNQSFFREMRMYPLLGGYLNAKGQYELMITLPENIERYDFSHLEIDVKKIEDWT